MVAQVPQKKKKSSQSNQKQQKQREKKIIRKIKSNSEIEYTIKIKWNKIEIGIEIISSGALKLIAKQKIISLENESKIIEMSIALNTYSRWTKVIIDVCILDR